MTTTPPPFPDSPSLRERVRLALREDLSDKGDITSQAIFEPGQWAASRMVAKQSGFLAGLPLVRIVFQELDSRVKIENYAPEGSRMSIGQVLARIEGPIRSLLAGERLALNFLQRLSGIATQTRLFVEASMGRVQICDTRKTTPLWRDMEKYAIAVGGGTNHRFGLYDAVMLKDTHADGSEGLARALERVRSLRPAVQVACEARTLEEVRAALEEKADLIMLDNMDEPMMREAIALIQGRTQVEITGGVTIDNIGRFVALGVDRVSIGSLTHSVKAVDISMKIES